LTWPSDRGERGERGKERGKKYWSGSPKTLLIGLQPAGALTVLVVPFNGTGCSSAVGFLLLHTSYGFGCSTTSPQFPCFACFGCQQAPLTNGSHHSLTQADGNEPA